MKSFDGLGPIPVFCIKPGSRRRDVSRGKRSADPQQPPSPSPESEKVEEREFLDREGHQVCLGLKH